MEKRIWSKPEMNEFAFAANEYVAGCTDLLNKFWKFICDFGGGKHYDIYSGAYDDTKNPQQNAKFSDLLTQDSRRNQVYYHACGTTHYVKQEEGKTWENYFLLGWADDDADDDEIGNVTKDVYIWTDGGTDVHVTSQVGEEIETVAGNKS
ncbi:MAG: hypothetical protein ACI4MP_14525 [Candidatus Ventricola sp.]